MNFIPNEISPNIESFFPLMSRQERFFSNKLSQKVYFPALSKAYKYFMPSYQNKLIKKLEGIFLILSDGNIKEFIKEICNTTNFRKKIILPVSEELNNNSILSNINNSIY